MRRCARSACSLALAQPEEASRLRWRTTRHNPAQPGAAVVQVKAITYSAMEVHERPDGSEIFVIVDI